MIQQVRPSLVKYWTPQVSASGVPNVTRITSFHSNRRTYCKRLLDTTDDVQRPPMPSLRSAIYCIQMHTPGVQHDAPDARRLN